MVPIQNLNILAAMAMKEGLSFEAAIQAITLNAAKIIEMDDRIGSLETDKDADVVIWSGNPFELASEPLWTIIDGEVVYQKEIEESC